MNTQLLVSKQNEIIAHLRRELSVKEEFIASLQMKIAELQTSVSVQILQQLQQLTEQKDADDQTTQKYDQKLQTVEAPLQQHELLLSEANTTEEAKEVLQLREQLQASEAARLAQRSRLEELIGKYEQQSNLIFTLKELNQALKIRLEVQASDSVQGAASQQQTQ